MFNKEKYPNCYEGHQYALDILEGKVTANKWIKGACKRYLKDLERIKEDKECPFYFRVEKAERFLRIVQNFHHAVGHWEAATIVYEPWQKFMWMNIKGFYSHVTKMIRFRTAHCDVARGNAKSTMASQAALYEMCCDNPNGNRIYCAATNRLQASEVLEGSRIMAKKNPSFRNRFGVDVRAHEVIHPASNSYIKAISAQANSLDGKIGKLIITDELHAMQRKTFEVLDSGQSKRRDSLLLSITTAGYANDGVGYSQRAYAKKVALGDIDDDTFFSLVYAVDDGDDPFDPDVWIKANPNFGVSVDPDNFAAKAKKAKNNPEDVANFKIKHLNLYLDSLHQYYDVLKWEECRDETLSIEQFKGKPCYCAIDLATKVDIVSSCYVFKEDDLYYFFFDNYCPQERVNLTKNRNYLRYVEEGDLIPMQGSVNSIPKIQDKIVEDSTIYKFRDFHYDPWNAAEMSTRLAAKGIDMTEFRMSVGNLSEPMKKLKELMLEKKIRHNCGSMLSWCVGNVAAKVDANDNVFPRKEHEEQKIDPMVSAIMALAGWINDSKAESVYETRGLVVL